MFIKALSIKELDRHNWKLGIIYIMIHYKNLSYL